MTTETAFGTYLQVLRRRKWWIISLALIGLVISLALSLTAGKRYSATAQVLVESPTGPQEFNSVQQPITQTDVETELQLVTSAQVKATVRQKIGNAPGVSASEVGQTNVIAITATSVSPARAALIANAYARAFVGSRQAAASRDLASAEEQLRSQISALRHQLASFHGKAKASPEASALLNQEAVLKEQLAQMQVSGAVNAGGVVLITPAQLPLSPSSPKPVRDALLGLAAGLLVGLGAAFTRDNLDDRLDSKEATEHAGGVPVLAMVPTVPSWRRRQQAVVVSANDPTSPGAEAYRSLRTSLQFTRQQRQLRTILVTSPAASEGKTSTLANLGVVFAQAGERVVLVSCDLRRPRLGEFFGVNERNGFTTVATGERALEDVLVPAAGFERLWLLPAGVVPPNPVELLNSSFAEEIFARLIDSFDVVLIDSPPVLPVTDSAVLSRYSDATLMVVAVGQTRRADLRRAAEKLEQVSAPVMGIVLNQVTKQSGYGYGHRYEYGYKPYLGDVPSVNGGSHRGGRSPETQSVPPELR